VRAAARSLGAFILRYRGVIAVALLLADRALRRPVSHRRRMPRSTPTTPVRKPPATVKRPPGTRTRSRCRAAARPCRSVVSRRLRPVFALAGRCLADDAHGHAAVGGRSARPTAVATFVSPLSGRVHVDCGRGARCTSHDADDSGWDFSWLLPRARGVLPHRRCCARAAPPNTPGRRATTTRSSAASGSVAVVTKSAVVTPTTCCASSLLHCSGGAASWASAKDPPSPSVQVCAIERLPAGPRTSRSVKPQLVRRSPQLGRGELVCVIRVDRRLASG